MRYFRNQRVTPPPIVREIAKRSTERVAGVIPFGDVTEDLEGDASLSPGPDRLIETVSVLDVTPVARSRSGARVELLDHGRDLTGLRDDDHDLYYHLDGIRALRGDIPLGSSARNLTYEGTTAAQVSANSSATQYLVLTSRSAGFSARLTCDGNLTDQDLDIRAKGAGEVVITNLKMEGSIDFSGSTHDHETTGGGLLDHGAAMVPASLEDDDHTQYHNNARGDARYYTEDELNAGQLDGRYYTETELDGGQLDGQYYTETELDGGQLDGQYYTETELDAGQLDNRYFTEAEHLDASAGVGDAGKPVKLDVAGHIDATMLNDGDVDHGSLGGLEGDDHTQYLLADGTRAMSGALDMGSQAITSVGNVDGRDVSTDGTKLDGIEETADITDATNVAAAGAIMDGDITGNGLMIRTGAGSYTNRSVAVADPKLVVSNADGTAGNPTLAFGSVAVADLSDIAAKSGSGTTVIMQGSPTLTTPTIADLTNATHDHSNNAGGGSLAVSAHSHAMLDGSIHTDSVADEVTRGSLIVCNATPKWDELVIGVTNQYLRVVGSDPAWCALDISDDPSPTLSSHLDLDGNDIKDDSRAYARVDDGLYVTGTLGVGRVPASITGLRVEVDGSVARFGITGNCVYTGTNSTIYGLVTTTTHQQASPSGNQVVFGCHNTATNDGIADVGTTMSSYGLWSRGVNAGAQDEVTAVLFAYGIYASGARSGTGNNTAGNFFGYSLYVEDPIAPGGAPTSHQEWCALFAGDIQINSDKKLILEGSKTSKGDTYLLYDSGNSTLDVFLGGAEKMNISATAIACLVPLQVVSKTDATRGGAGTVGLVIFNTDDGQLNIDDGANWTLPDGTAT